MSIKRFIELLSFALLGGASGMLFGVLTVASQDHEIAHIIIVIMVVMAFAIALKNFVIALFRGERNAPADNAILLVTMGLTYWIFMLLGL